MPCAHLTIDGDAVDADERTNIPISARPQLARSGIPLGMWAEGTITVTGQLVQARRQLVRPTDDAFGLECERINRDRRRDRKSVVYGKRVSVRVDLGGRCIINNKHPGLTLNRHSKTNTY